MALRTGKKKTSAGLLRIESRRQGGMFSDRLKNDFFRLHRAECAAEPHLTPAVRTGGCWRYAFPLPSRNPVEEIHVRCEQAGVRWNGLFQCASRGQLNVTTWPGTNTIIVAAVDALYIVDPVHPEHFGGFSAPVEINNFIFDESAEHVFVAESLRLYCFSAIGHFRWISPSLGGYGTRLLSCHDGLVLAESNRDEDLETESAPFPTRVRVEDGTILRTLSAPGWARWRKLPAA